MLKRILIGGLFLGLGLLAAAAIGMFFLYRTATATPQFYAEAVETPVSEEAAEDFESSFSELMPLLNPELAEVGKEASVEPPTDSADPAVAGEFEDGEFPTPEGGDAVDASDDLDNRADDEVNVASEDAEASPQTATVTIRDGELNSWLAMNAEQVAREIGPELSHPRFRFSKGRIEGGVRLDLPPYHGVLAGEIKPVLVDRERFELHFVGFRVGRLNFPIQNLTGKPQDAEDEIEPGVRMETVTPPPRVVLTWNEMEGLPSRITAFEIGEGQLTVTLEAMPDDDEPDGEEELATDETPDEAAASLRAEENHREEVGADPAI